MLSWQQWLQINYKVISMWARRWHHTEWRELMAHMAIYLQKNWSRFSTIPDDEQRIKFLQTWMKNNVKWDNSQFNKSISVNNLEEDFDQSRSKESYDEPFDILAEDMTDDIKDFIIDLHRRFDEPDAMRIIKIRKIYLTLPAHEKVLYDLYFTQMLSVRGVAKKLQLPLTSVHYMIVELKEKIKDLC